MTTFKDLGLAPEILEALTEVGYETPSPIQEQAIPTLLEGRDMIGQAQTGSGKTAAFGLPLLNYVDASDPDVQALVLTPTRELCIQVTQAIRSYGAKKGIDVVAVFGGAPIKTQQAQLRSGGQVVVGTVGRVKDLISRHSLVLHSCRFVVLDEADEMLDLGFLEDVEKILSLTPSSRQTALFSATMPPEIRNLSEKYLYEPALVKVQAENLTVDTVEQFSLEVPRKDKPDALAAVLKAERPGQAIVFMRTKIGCDQLFRKLKNEGMKVLIATDVAARGLDVSTVTHVINFDVPNSPDTYVHRIGRTGRVGRSGRAVTFYEPKQDTDLAAIEKHTGITMGKWSSGATTIPQKTTAPPKRHEKPKIEAKPDAPAKQDGPLQRLIASVGKDDGVEVRDIIAALTKVGLQGEQIHNVKVLGRFSLLEVPQSEAERVCREASGSKVGNAELKLEVAGG
ncbi:MAG: DEAD/DEAH box helicase [Solirubrobacterales bacterium]|nr:DEAD/DEAH box helicase [Solirubrobacterales bacterium]